MTAREAISGLTHGSPSSDLRHFSILTQRAVQNATEVANRVRNKIFPYGDIFDGTKHKIPTNSSPERTSVIPQTDTHSGFSATDTITQSYQNTAVLDTAPRAAPYTNAEPIGVGIDTQDSSGNSRNHKKRIIRPHSRRPVEVVRTPVVFFGQGSDLSPQYRNANRPTAQEMAEIELGMRLLEMRRRKSIVVYTS